MTCDSRFGEVVEPTFLLFVLLNLYLFILKYVTTYISEYLENKHSQSQYLLQKLLAFWYILFWFFSLCICFLKHAVVTTVCVQYRVFSTLTQLPFPVAFRVSTQTNPPWHRARSFGEGHVDGPLATGPALLVLGPYLECGGSSVILLRGWRASWREWHPHSPVTHGLELPAGLLYSPRQSSSLPSP